jgi:DNA-directed RNA polymerase specialized sigma24 family protein
MAERPSAALAHLADTTKRLSTSLVDYQRALLAAREAGATHTQIAEILGTSESGARWRHKAAQDGGEVHLRLWPTNTPQVPAPRGHE